MKGYAPTSIDEQGSILLSLSMLAASGESLDIVAAAACSCLARALNVHAALYITTASGLLERVGASPGSPLPHDICPDSQHLAAASLAAPGLVQGRHVTPEQQLPVQPGTFLFASGCHIAARALGTLILAGDARAAVSISSSQLLVKVMSLITHSLAHEALSRERDEVLFELNRLSQCDPLTGLANRRALSAHIDGALKTARDDGTEISLAMLDIDFFKSWNDSMGHAAGDDLLVQTAAVWSAATRSNDIIARYGGEEFVLVFPNTGIRTAHTVLERLRGMMPFEQTCSAGLARWNYQESAAQLLARADEALYLAKAGGRDRTVLASC